jgi:hypothetical protein
MEECIRARRADWRGGGGIEEGRAGVGHCVASLAVFVSLSVCVWVFTE